MKRIATVLVVLVGTTGTALAQTATETAKDESSRTLDLTGVVLDGDVLKPEHVWVPVRRGAQFGSHIHLRRHFQPELDRSTSSL